MLNLGIIGCGNIGRTIIKAIYEGKIDCKVSGVFDVNKDGYNILPDEIKKQVKFFYNFEEFINTDANLILEAASQDAVKTYAVPVLKHDKNLILMSVGALVDKNLFECIKEIARAKNLKIYIPSGAVVGIDGVKAALLGGIESVTLTTRKNPKGLGITTDEEKILFDGNASDAVGKFPKNINVAATLSLAGIGFGKTNVRIIADPNVRENIHEIRIKGKFGEILTVAKNLPSPDNPKTSYLASLAAIACLKKITSEIEIGT
ncbi:putative L-aspartate dehydrogenase [groundwater metagenome]|uniref:Putative L-aspartate dehydrogenase n=1 Tax=groundwater metagenome TaxID=717931 RepID=A0A098ECR0_9ZZZZ